MVKKLFVIFLLLLSAVACVANRSASDPIVAPTYVTEVDYRNVQIAQGQTLPPYGMTIMAETAVLELSVRSSQKESADGQRDLRIAVDHITQLASENELIALDAVLVGAVGGDYEYVRDSSSYTTWNLDASMLTIRLAMPLEAQDQDLMRCITGFNAFIQTIALSKTTTIQVVSVQTELGDLEPYRGQIVEKVYAELDAVQAQYGETVKYEISGLHGRLNVMKLTDVEYYVYLEPVVLVKEF